MQTLRKKLLDLDGKGYKSYKSIAGRYHFSDTAVTFDLVIDHVQGDPFALPSRISIFVAHAQAQLPDDLWQHAPNTRIRRVALEDFLRRALAAAIARHVKGRRGAGCSGKIGIAAGGQQVLVRNALLITEQGIEARLTVGLPAENRRAAGHEAIAMFFEELPQLVATGLCFKNLDTKQAQRHVHSVEDQQALRDALHHEGWVAFVANGSRLPRASGVDDRPLKGHVLPFIAPDSLTHTVSLPNAGTISGLAIPAGVTLIVGGGFHGKSTLLQALQVGVYNHIPADGREQVATLDSAVKIRAEDGRAIHKVNISPFIDHLPFGRDTVNFSTENASGSTSQAANIIEALECGAKLLLIDEDTSASNFMIRDQRMQQLVCDDKEPITPLIHRVRELYREHGVSSVIVMGGSGDYFDVADTVIMMDAYQPRDVTQQAHALARPLGNPSSTLPDFMQKSSRCPDPQALDASRGNRPVKINTPETGLLLYGTQRIDLSQVEQLVDIDQTRCIGLMMHYLARYNRRPRSKNDYSDLNNDLNNEKHNNTKDHDSLASALRQIMADAEQFGLDIFSEYKVGNLALPRLFELASAINRLRHRCPNQGEKS